MMKILLATIIAVIAAARTSRPTRLGADTRLSPMTPKTFLKG
jgi:hypothetical protein